MIPSPAGSSMTLISMPSRAPNTVNLAGLPLFVNHEPALPDCLLDLLLNELWWRAVTTQHTSSPNPTAAWPVRVRRQPQYIVPSPDELYGNEIRNAFHRCPFCRQAMHAGAKVDVVVEVRYVGVVRGFDLHSHTEAVRSKVGALRVVVAEALFSELYAEDFAKFSAELLNSFARTF